MILYTSVPERTRSRRRALASGSPGLYVGRSSGMSDTGACIWAGKCGSASEFYDGVGVG